MKQPLAFVAVLLATLTAGHATSQGLRPSCEILYYGIFENRIGESTVHRGTTTYNHVQSGEIPDEATTLIPATLGIDFGVAISFKNIPQGEEIEAVISHPLIVTPDGQRLTQSVTPMSPAAAGNSYRFEEPFEVVPGEWKFEYFHRGVRLCDKRFHVIDTTLK